MKTFRPTHILCKGDWEELDKKGNWFKSEWDDAPKVITYINEDIVAVHFFDDEMLEHNHTIYKGEFIL